MNGRSVWVSVEGKPRRGTVARYTYAPGTGALLLAVELEETVDGTEAVVVNPRVDDVLFEVED